MASNIREREREIGERERERDRRERERETAYLARLFLLVFDLFAPMKVVLPP
jgi:hypothetical protein